MTKKVISFNATDAVLEILKKQSNKSLFINNAIRGYEDNSDFCVDCNQQFNNYVLDHNNRCANCLLILEHKKKRVLVES